ncbi:unnamed protein product [Zymoseptoria tritici ST99CH_3D7]|uniref:Uncharacterized protein n=1 Tax=Zymoseptoria tritici (strain ST99CH_3D7) TaxID=1276538 RepID=A0A1X7RUV3_ZYMT9|nr:unnamed protein product [Zymoseptoria tritici ST99CH_3D7]
MSGRGILIQQVNESSTGIPGPFASSAVIRLIRFHPFAQASVPLPLLTESPCSHNILRPDRPRSSTDTTLLPVADPSLDPLYSSSSPTTESALDVSSPSRDPFRPRLDTTTPFALAPSLSTAPRSLQTHHHHSPTRHHTVIHDARFSISRQYYSNFPDRSPSKKRALFVLPAANLWTASLSREKHNRKTQGNLAQVGSEQALLKGYRSLLGDIAQSRDIVGRRISAKLQAPVLVTFVTYTRLLSILDD